MPMFAWLNKGLIRFSRDTSGNTLLEFAFVIPVWLLLMTGMLEVGRAYFQANALDKAVRAGATYAARNTIPLSNAVKTEAENIIKTGNKDGNGGYLVSGWGVTGSSLAITTSDYAIDETSSVGVIRVVASVPFDAVLPGMGSFVGLDNFTIQSTHEQAYVGD